jgi:hypothetical protein
VEDLERDHAVVLAVLGEIDGGHASSSKLAINRI